MANENQEEKSATRLQIEYKKLPVAQLSNEMIVQSDGEFLYVHFAQIQPPLVESAEDLKKLRETIRSIAAEPVASVAMTFDKAEAFIDALKSQLQRARLVVSALKSDQSINSGENER